MDGEMMNILALIIRSANGDEEATAEIREHACAGLLKAIRSLEKLTDVRIEPGSFLLGMAFEARDGMNGFIDPDTVNHYMLNAETIREMYARQEAQE